MEGRKKSIHVDGFYGFTKNAVGDRRLFDDSMIGWVSMLKRSCYLIISNFKNY